MSEIFRSNSTTHGRPVHIAKATDDAYLVYRHGKGGQIELEYPADKANSWAAMKYYNYLRGGGTDNEGLDINQLYFYHGQYKYVVYNDTYSEKLHTGLMMIDKAARNEIDLKADPATVKGTLITLRDYEQLPRHGTEEH